MRHEAFWISPSLSVLSLRAGGRLCLLGVAGQEGHANPIPGYRDELPNLSHTLAPVLLLTTQCWLL